MKTIFKVLGTIFACAIVALILGGALPIACIYGLKGILLWVLAVFMAIGGLEWLTKKVMVSINQQLTIKK